MSKQRIGSISIGLALVGTIVTVGTLLYRFGVSMNTTEMTSSEAKNIARAAELKADLSAIKVQEVEKAIIEIKTNVDWIKAAMNENGIRPRSPR